MTIDDESSIYVGGLPYDATENSVRRVFDSYGDVVAVKVKTHKLMSLISLVSRVNVTVYGLCCVMQIFASIVFFCFPFLFFFFLDILLVIIS